jgi:hypothetical protein
MADNNLTRRKPTDLATRSKQDPGGAIAAFVQRSQAAAVQAAKKQNRPRLIYGLDATASRQPTWDMASQLMGEMVREVAGLDQQLVYYRGNDECRASPWFPDAVRLANAMTKITCAAGKTQIARILTHCRNETKQHPVSALAFVGDAIEENIDEFAAIAGELGRLGVKTFMFQEGDDPKVEAAFREIARLTEGAYCRFDAGAPRQLAELLGAVAAYARGGITALQAQPGAARLLSFFKVK